MQVRTKSAARSLYVYNLRLSSPFYGPQQSIFSNLAAQLFSQNLVSLKRFEEFEVSKRMNKKIKLAMTF